MSEFDIQCAGVSMAKAYLIHRWPGYCLVLKKSNGEKYIGVPLYHIENEGKRNARQQRNSKRMGMVSGVWDLSLDISTNGYKGLKIEVKSGKNKLTYNQKKWEKHYRLQGYQTKVCRTAQEILGAVRDYMEGENK